MVDVRRVSGSSPLSSTNLKSLENTGISVVSRLFVLLISTFEKGFKRSETAQKRCNRM